LIQPSITSIATAVTGGALIGTSASLLLRLNGRIAGISGIIAGLFDWSSLEAGWKRLFLAGLLAGGVVFAVASPATIAVDVRGSFARTVMAGLLVGVGTRLAGGCTSGHGVCGISRLSTRSLLATVVFMATGILTVFVTRHLIAVQP